MTGPLPLPDADLLGHLRTRPDQPDLPAYAADPEGEAWDRYRRKQVLAWVGWDAEEAPDP